MRPPSSLPDRGPASFAGRGRRSSSVGEVTTWTFGCDAWLFGDGVYSHIEVGQELEASIEFWQIGRFHVIDAQTTKVEPTGPRTYRVEASIASLSGYAVLDLEDFLVSCHAAPMTYFDELHAGDYVKGTIGLALNPFNWQPESFPRRKTWMVDAITRSRGQSFSKADKQPVRAVDSRTVDDNAWFVIECRLASAG